MSNDRGQFTAGLGICYGFIIICRKSISERNIALLHGKLSARAKSAIMADFNNGLTDIP